MADKKKEVSRSLRFSPKLAQKLSRGRKGFSKGINKSDFGEDRGLILKSLDLKAL